MRRIFGQCALALAVLIAASVGPLSTMLAKGDTNGDSEIDVLDLQRVIAEVLGSGKAAAPSDINGDGKVDVLDFQALLTQAQQAAPAPGDAPRQNNRGTSPNTRSADEAIVRVARIRPVSPEEGKSASSLSARPALDSFVASSKTERHLRNLSQHAPPVLG